MAGQVCGVLGRIRSKSSKYVVLLIKSHRLLKLGIQNDYHLIAPDLRGFGSSTHPDDVESSGTMGDIVGDLVCILEHAAVSSAICVGYKSRFYYNHRFMLIQRRSSI
jgi:pimeloyl-ACP methyl ester carboxylesterase